MICFIYPFRNRDAARVKRSLDSLAAQTNTTFRVEFVDFGSDGEVAGEIEDLLRSYTFARYTYHDVGGQAWNKCRALNSVIRELQDPFCFVADVDMIYHPEFVDILHAQKSEQTAVYFQVGFLDEAETRRSVAFEQLEPKFLSDPGATGLTLFPVKALQAIKGFDEFYHFWGSEDTDVHVRLGQAGYPVRYYDKEVLLYHQWHRIYRDGDPDRLTATLRVKGIERINYHYLQQVKAGKGPLVNPKGWGDIPAPEDIKALEAAEPLVLSNETGLVQAFLHGILPSLPKGMHAFRFEDRSTDATLRTKIKSALGKKQVSYLDFKELNDRLLLTTLSHYRHRPYTFLVDPEGPSIELRVSI